MQQIIDDLRGRGGARRPADRLDRWRVLEPDAGRFLWFLVQSLRRHDDRRDRHVAGRVHALAGRRRPRHRRPGRHDRHRRHRPGGGPAQRRGGGARRPGVIPGRDGGAALAGYGDGELDLLFLDAERTEYPGWWPHPSRVLRPGGVLVADNATSHPEEIAALRALVEADPALVTTTIGVGKGELLALRR